MQTQVGGVVVCSFALVLGGCLGSGNPDGAPQHDGGSGVDCAVVDAGGTDPGRADAGFPAPRWAFAVEADERAQVFAVAAPSAPVAGGPAWVFVTRAAGGKAGVLATQGGLNEFGLQALDATGAPTWGRQVALLNVDNSNDRGEIDWDHLSMHVDTAGNTWLAGAYRSWISWWIRDGVVDDSRAHARGWDSFFAGWAADGGLQVHIEPNSDQDDAIRGVDTTADGRLLLGGWFQAGFRPTGDDAFRIESHGGADAIVARVDLTSEAPPDVITAATPRDERVSALRAGPAGGVFFAGDFSFQLGLGDKTVRGGSRQDSTLALVQFDGSTSWSVVAGGVNDETSGHLARLSDGVLWTLTLGRGGTVGPLTLARGGHVVVNVSDSGVIRWAHAIPEATSARPLRVAANAAGEFMLAGDGFVGRYDASGNPRWVRAGADAFDAHDVASDGTTFTVVGDAAGGLPIVTTELPAEPGVVQGLVANFE